MRARLLLPALASLALALTPAAPMPTPPPPRIPLDVLLHEDLPVAVDEWLARTGNSWRSLVEGRIVVAGSPVTLDELQHHLIDLDPVLWCEVYLVERDAGDGRPWRFWPFQKESMRFRGHSVHMDGAEVGKTREIVGLSAWHVATRRPGDVLIAAPQDGALELIWDELIWQLEQTPTLAVAVDWDKTKVKPYRKARVHDAYIHLRPAALDGQPFRGIHAGGFGLYDEIAKAKNPAQVSEFIRGLKRTAEIRLYSVPDGDRASPYAKYCERAPLVTTWHEAQRSAAGAEGARRFVRWHWPQTLKPDWGPQRKAELIELYGGEDTPGYQHNVLGVHGEEEFAVFPWHQMAAVAHYLPEYREVLLRWDAEAGLVHVRVVRLDPTYQLRHGAATLDDDQADDSAPAASPTIVELEDEIPTADWDAWDLGAWLRPLDGLLAAGCDPGRSPDPLEIVFLRHAAGPGGADRRQVLARIQARGFDYDRQRDLALAADAILRPELGWGLDVSGVGTALEHILVEGAVVGGDHRTLAERITPYHGGSTVPLLDDDGDPLTDPATGRTRSITTKERATIALERGIQRRQWEFPRHPEWLIQWSNHTATKEGPRGRVFANHDDHTIEAVRAAVHRWLTLEHADATPPVAIHIPRGLTHRPVARV